MRHLITKVVFNCDLFWSEAEYEKLSELEKTKIINVESISTFDFIDDDNNYVCYMIISPIEMSKYEGILLSLDIKYYSFDLCNSILHGEIDLKSIFERYSHPMNLEGYEDFFENLEEWIMKNQSVDNVLDMINRKGFASLRKIDKDFLDNYSASLLKK
jgi:hypothetical protein